MAMKVNDDVEDVEGRNFDKLMGLPNLALWAAEETKRTGIPSSEILSKLKEYYIQRSGGNIVRAINKTLAVGSHLSGKIKNAESRNGIVPSDDLWQLSRLIREFHTPTSTVLRHQLEESGLLRLALS